MLTPVYDRREIWNQTVEYYKDTPFMKSSVFRRDTDLTSNEINNLERKWSATVISPVIQKDCIYLAIEYNERGYNPIILNMSDWRKAGGNVEGGSPAQEEELFRRSNYHKHLTQDLYPLNYLDTIVSHDVEFFRYGVDKGYVKIKEPIHLDCIAAPAVRFPQLNRVTGDFANDTDKQFMIQKIRMLLYTAAKNGNDCIILSAWGCGAYGCPVTTVAKLFKQVLTEFAGVFRETPFAILGTNFLPFYEIFNSA